MNEQPAMPQHQIDRILSATSQVAAMGNEGAIDPSLVEKVVRLEVEFQFVEDRDRVLRRIRDIVEDHLQHQEPDGKSEGPE